MFTATTPPSPPRKRGRPRLTGLEQNRGPGIPLSDERRAAVEGTMNGEQLELLAAVQLWKRVNRRGYPSLTELLVILQLGYRKVLARAVILDGAPEPELFKF